MEERNIHLNWEEDIPKILELIQVPEGYDKEAILMSVIGLLAGG